MNYLRNRYPFKLLTNFFRMAIPSSDTANNNVDLKRNKSDSALSRATRNSSMQTTLNSDHSSVIKLSKSVSEYPNLEKKSSRGSLQSVNSNSSLPVSKTSSEHVLISSSDNKKPLFDIQSLNKFSLKKCNSNLKHELRSKLEKLHQSLKNSGCSSKEVITEDEQSKWKGSYPWKAFNLNSVQQTLSEDNVGKTQLKLALKNNCVATSTSAHSILSLSNSSLTSKSSSQSLGSFNSSSTISTECKTSATSLGDLEDLSEKNQFVKSILKKPMEKGKPMKEVKFNSISTIYGPSSTCCSQTIKAQSVASNVSKNSSNELSVKENSYSSGHQSKINRDSVKNVRKRRNSSADFTPYCEKYLPPQKEHSFISLYNRKRPKN